MERPIYSFIYSNAVFATKCYFVQREITQVDPKDTLSTNIGMSSASHQEDVGSNPSKGRFFRIKMKNVMFKLLRCSYSHIWWIYSDPHCIYCLSLQDYSAICSAIRSI